jgi:hypothetical protein
MFSLAKNNSLTSIVSRENQAHGRIYRIGQKKPTMFVTLVVEATIDHFVVGCKFHFRRVPFSNKLIVYVSARKEGIKYHLGHGNPE